MTEIIQDTGRARKNKTGTYPKSIFRLISVGLTLLLVCAFLPGCGGVVGEAVDKVSLIVKGILAYREMSGEAADGFDVREARAKWYGALEAYNADDVDRCRNLLDETSRSLDNLDQVAERIYYNSADGTRVSGLLFRPETGSPPWPLIVVNHAGFGTAGDFSDVALMVRDKGYLVFNPDFRGSGMSEGEVELAGGEVDDVIEGVKYIRSLGIVDNGRIGMFGQSHGAAVSLLAAGRYPDIKAVVAEAGFTEMHSLEENAKNSDNPAIRALNKEVLRRLGREPTEEDYSRRSAVNYVDGVQAAILLIHGNKDPLVPARQSELMYEALRKAGKTVEIKIYPEEQHCVENPESRKEVWDLMFNWFEKYV